MTNIYKLCPKSDNVPRWLTYKTRGRTARSSIVFVPLGEFALRLKIVNNWLGCPYLRNKLAIIELTGKLKPRVGFNHVLFFINLPSTISSLRTP